MSPKIPSLAAAGLTALGLGMAALPGVAAPQDPPAPPATAADSPSPTAEEAGPPTVLLLSNGNVLRGEITQDPSGYWIKLRIGVIQKARRDVLGAFRSLEEAYRFRLARLPADDADEQMKLAQWCLEQKLQDHAQTHLAAVLQLNPEHKQAQAMLLFLSSAPEAPADPGLARTSAEVPAEAEAADLATPPSDPAMPRELSPSALDRLRTLGSEHRPVGAPVIFDLPAPLAVRRYEEYRRGVHRQLQEHCAKCHDADTYGGAFRLVRARTSKDMANNLLVLTNLDATLTLVNPDDLAHSELLSVAALTHPSDGRPVLGGPNHPSYRVFLNWVNGLQDPTRAPSASASAVVPTGYSPPSRGEGFAVGRRGMAPASGGPVEQPYVYGAPLRGQPRVVNGLNAREQGVHPDVPPNAQFPTPTRFPAVPPPGGVGVGGGPILPPPGPAAAGPGQPTLPQAPAVQAGQPGTIVVKPDGTQGMVLPDGTVADFVSSKQLRDGPPRLADPPAEENEDDALAPGDAKPKARIDPAALQQFMQRRAPR
jgi:hypothetical protein